MENNKELFQLSDYSCTEKFSVWNHINTFFHKLHYHDCVEVFIYHGENGTHYINGKEYAMKNNNMYLLSLNDYHSIYNLPEKNNIFNLMISTKMIDKSVMNKINAIQDVKIAELNEFASKQVDCLLATLECMQQNEIKYCEKFYKNIIDNILYIFFRFRISPETNRSTHEDDENIQGVENSLIRALSYITTHFKENINLNDIAKASGYSATYLSSLFHKKTGYTFKEYINHSRISLAKRLLSNTNNNISFICYECGFNSMTSFLRNFIEIEKCTPSEFRNKDKRHAHCGTNKTADPADEKKTGNRCPSAPITIIKIES